MIDRAQVLAWTLELTKEAGDRARAMLSDGQERTILRKEDDTIVTDIDRAIERFLRDAITGKFPEHAVLGEEYGFEGFDDAPLWALDPIDGTTNLANGLPQWGVSVGLIEDGKPIVGAVSFPLLNEIYAGARGLGATKNGDRLSPLLVARSLDGDDVYGICSYSVHEMAFDKIDARLRLTGSAALDLCWTASGRFRGSQSMGVKLYDVAAAMVLTHEVGADSVWLKNGEPWSADAMLKSGPREDDILLTATPMTLNLLRESLHL